MFPTRLIHSVIPAWLSRLIELVVTESNTPEFDTLPGPFDIIGVWTHRLDKGLLQVRVLVRSDRVEPILKEFDTKSGLPAAVVGVMVAVALLPPLVSAGLLLGAGEIVLAGRAFLLPSTNVICVNLAGVAALLWQGVRPGKWWEAERSRKMTRLAWAVWITLLVVLIPLISLADPVW